MDDIKVGSKVKLKGDVSNHINPDIARLNNVHGTVRKIYPYANRGCRPIIHARVEWDGDEFQNNIFFGLDVSPNTSLGRTEFEKELNKDGMYAHWQLRGLELVKENQ